MHKVGPGLLALRIEYSLRDSHRAPSVTLDGPSSPLATPAVLKTCWSGSFKDVSGPTVYRHARSTDDSYGSLPTAKHVSQLPHR